MNGCVYKTASGQCQKYSDKHTNTLAWCCGDNIICKDRKPSNADRIRAMTDEELASFIEIMKFNVCEAVARICGITGLDKHWDKEGIAKEELEWLKQEAT